MNGTSPRYVAVAAVSALLLLIGALLIQNFRHGWPFSLHHGVATTAPKAQIAVQPRSATVPTRPLANVDLSQTQIDAFGIRMDTARRETISQPVRVAATVVPDESRISHVHTRVSGWVERLYVNTTGASVRAGQPLAALFSQELLSSQGEYLAARRSSVSGPRSAVGEGARKRLAVFGMSEAEIRAIEQTGEPQRLVTVTAPRSGVVVNRGISVGTAVDPSTEIMTIADLSEVWVLAEVPEADVSSIQVGTSADLDFVASGRASLSASVDFLYPTLSERSRTLRVRFSAKNADGSLRPGMYGTATFHVTPRQGLTVPRDAIVDTGDAQYVFVAAGDHRFVPRPVKLGARLGERIEIREGLAADEPIVASGVFLIDSESRLRASSGGTGLGHSGMNMGQDGSNASQGAGGPASSKENEVPRIRGDSSHGAHDGKPGPPR